MNWQINHNGNTANDIKGQFIELSELLYKVEQHMNAMTVFHGRNYQTVENADHAQSQDIAEFREKIATISETRKYAMAGASRAIRAREGL